MLLTGIQPLTEFEADTLNAILTYLLAEENATGLFSKNLSECSESTPTRISRHFNALERKGWIKKAGENYQLTFIV